MTDITPSTWSVVYGVFDGSRAYTIHPSRCGGTTVGATIRTAILTTSGPVGCS